MLLSVWRIGVAMRDISQTLRRMPDLSLERDLGINSIKRLEILGSFLRYLAGVGVVVKELSIEKHFAISQIPATISPDPNIRSEETG